MAQSQRLKRSGQPKGITGVTTDDVESKRTFSSEANDSPVNNVAVWRRQKGSSSTDATENDDDVRLSRGRNVCSQQGNAVTRRRRN